MENNNNILIVSDGFPPEGLAGAESIAYIHAKGMKRRGYNVLVYTTTKERESEGKTEYDGIAIYKLYSTSHERWRAYRSLYNGRAIKKFTALLAEFDPGVIHFHNIHSQLSYALFKHARKHTARVYLTVHDMMLFAYDKINYFTERPKLSNGDYNYKLPFLYNLKYAKKRFNPIRNLFIKRALGCITKIFSVSNEVQKALEQNSIKNIVTIHNGINADEWQSTNDEVRNTKERFNIESKKVVLFVGRLTGNKGAYAMLDAMKHVVAKIPEAVLLIVGPQSNPKAMMDRPEIEGSVIFTGRIPYKDIKYVYHASDVVVVPSVYLDPFPTINLEAMACSKPVVGTTFGGTPEITEDNVTGYIANPKNAEEFASKIITLLKDTKKAQQFGTAGFERVISQFSQEIYIDSLLSHYNK